MAKLAGSKLLGQHRYCRSGPRRREHLPGVVDAIVTASGSYLEARATGWTSVVTFGSSRAAMVTGLDCSLPWKCCPRSRWPSLTPCSGLMLRRTVGITIGFPCFQLDFRVHFSMDQSVRHAEYLGHASRRTVDGMRSLEAAGEAGEGEEPSGEFRDKANRWLLRDVTSAWRGCRH